jgi:hypothetical protein
MREFGFRGDAVEVFVLVGIMGDCVIEVSNVQIRIIGLYSLEEETLYAFYETSGTNHPVTRRHIPRRTERSSKNTRMGERCGMRQNGE